MKRNIRKRKLGKWKLGNWEIEKGKFGNWKLRKWMGNLICLALVMGLGGCGLQNGWNEKEHKWITETVPAGCETPGSVRVVCKHCGYVESEELQGEPVGHQWNKVYWPSPPTCMCHGDYDMVCVECGVTGERGRDEAIAHSPIYREISHGDCSTETIMEAVCSMCGLEMGRECFYETEEHDWVRGTYETFDWSRQEVVQKTIVQCSRCGMEQGNIP